MRNLLWIDCVAAGVVGVSVVVLSGWLSELEGLPQSTLMFTGIVNLLYGCYSFSLARRAERPLGLIKVLVTANFAWVPVCIGLTIAHSNSMTMFGYVHLLGEAAFVGTLALLEWRYRDLIATNFVAA